LKIKINNIHLYEYIKIPKQTLKPPVAKRTRHYVPFGKHKSEKRGNGIMNPAKKLLDQYF
tara:strand:+ start:233 stop:412 length:180 start_codon:yes stop_codon:yes gene_type:complete